MVWFGEVFTYPNPTDILCLRCVCWRWAHFSGRKLDFFQFFILLPKVGRNLSLYIKSHLGLAGKEDVFVMWLRLKAPEKEVVK